MLFIIISEIELWYKYNAIIKYFMTNHKHDISNSGQIFPWLGIIKSNTIVLNI